MSNVPSLQTLVDWANIGIVITLAASFIFGGASIFLSRRLSKLRDAQSAREKQISDEKIEATKAEATRANTEAVRIENEGKERVAKVEANAKEKIAELTTEAETAKRDRAEADKQIALAKENAERAKAGAAQASQRTAELSLAVEQEARKRAEAERLYLELKEKIKDRHLTTEQRARLLELFKTNPKGGG